MLCTPGKGGSKKLMTCPDTYTDSSRTWTRFNSVWFLNPSILPVSLNVVTQEWDENDKIKNPNMWTVSIWFVCTQYKTKPFPSLAKWGQPSLVWLFLPLHCLPFGAETNSRQNTSSWLLELNGTLTLIYVEVSEIDCDRSLPEFTGILADPRLAPSCLTTLSALPIMPHTKCPQNDW